MRIYIMLGLVLAFFYIQAESPITADSINKLIGSLVDKQTAWAIQNQRDIMKHIKDMIGKLNATKSKAETIVDQQQKTQIINQIDTVIKSFQDALTSSEEAEKKLNDTEDKVKTVRAKK